MKLWKWLRGWIGGLKRPGEDDDTSLGRRGERLAERFLRRKGHRVVARRQRERLGEIDLVTVDRNEVVFVEVKTRQSDGSGHPAEAVDEAKQRQLTRVAMVFMKRHRLLEHRARFDVVAIIWPPGQEASIEHLTNAFPAQGCWQLFH